MKNNTTADVYDYTTWQIMQEYLPTQLLNDYRRLFNSCDPDREGVIRVKDISTILKDMGHTVSVMEITEVLQQIIGTVGSNSFVDFQEFIVIISMMNTDCVAEDEMSKVFRHFDKDGDGFISPIELKDMMLSFGEEIEDEALEEMIREADQDGDGKVSYNDFVRFMTNSTEEPTPTPISCASICEELSQLPVQNQAYTKDTPEASFTDESIVNRTHLIRHNCNRYMKRRSVRSRCTRKILSSVRRSCKGMLRVFKKINIQVGYDGSKKTFTKRFNIRSKGKISS